jgi:hypothetical protein
MQSGGKRDDNDWQDEMKSLPKVHVDSRSAA